MLCLTPLFNGKFFLNIFQLQLDFYLFHHFGIKLVKFLADLFLFLREWVQRTQMMRSFHLPQFEATHFRYESLSLVELKVYRILLLTRQFQQLRDNQLLLVQQSKLQELHSISFKLQRQKSQCFDRLRSRSCYKKINFTPHFDYFKLIMQFNQKLTMVLKQCQFTQDHC